MVQDEVAIMKFEFHQGCPADVFVWLRANVGLGNIEESNGRTQQLMVDIPEYAWFYERVKQPSKPDDPWKYVPTITVKDAKKSTLFALRWLS